MQGLTEDEATGLARQIHYPEHWDTAAYPTLGSALSEITAHFDCQCKWPEVTKSGVPYVILDEEQVPDPEPPLP